MWSTTSSRSAPGLGELREGLPGARATGCRLQPLEGLFGASGAKLTMTLASPAPGRAARAILPPWRYHLSPAGRGRTFRAQEVRDAPCTQRPVTPAAQDPGGATSASSCRGDPSSRHRHRAHASTTWPWPDGTQSTVGPAGVPRVHRCHQWLKGRTDEHDEEASASRRSGPRRGVTGHGSRGRQSRAGFRGRSRPAQQRLRAGQ
jgi:hypothetical protein